MPYDFSLPTDRRRTNSLKWDVEEFELPMWVADMDFRTAPAVVDALRAKVDAGVFGYTIVPPQYALAVRSWWARRHDFTIDEEWVTFATGVVPALSSVVRAMTAVGDAIVIQQPVYDIFTHSIVNNGRTVVSNDLVRDESGYRMDVDDLERRLADPRTTAMILCNPHNPVGRLWTRDELTTVARLAARHGVLVIADEVHGDLTAPGSRYIPFASVCAEAQANSISCWSAGKTFNLAGVQAASVVVPDRDLRARVRRALNTDEVAEPNAFAIEATIAAFQHGAPWLDELRTYLARNRAHTADYLRRQLPLLHLVEAQATYLAWIDCSAVTDDTTELVAFLRSEHGLVLSRGGAYGRPGTAFIRLNLACPRDRLTAGLDRLRDGVRDFAHR